MTTPAPCHDCGRLTWCLRQLCPWCDARRKAKFAEEREQEQHVPLWRVKMGNGITGKMNSIERERIDVQDHKEAIDNEGDGVTLADG